MFEVHPLSSQLPCNHSLLLKVVHDLLNGHDLSLIKCFSTTSHGLHAICRELFQPLPQLVEGVLTARGRGRRREGGREREMEVEIERSSRGRKDGGGKNT